MDSVPIKTILHWSESTQKWTYWTVSSILLSEWKFFSFCVHSSGSGSRHRHEGVKSVVSSHFLFHYESHNNTYTEKSTSLYTSALHRWEDYVWVSIDWISLNRLCLKPQRVLGTDKTDSCFVYFNKHTHSISFMVYFYGFWASQPLSSVHTLHIRTPFPPTPFSQADSPSLRLYFCRVSPLSAALWEYESLVAVPCRSTFLSWMIWGLPPAEADKSLMHYPAQQPTETAS